MLGLWPQRTEGFGSYLDVFFRENSNYFDDYQATCFKSPECWRDGYNVPQWQPASFWLPQKLWSRQTKTWLKLMYCTYFQIFDQPVRPGPPGNLVTGWSLALQAGWNSGRACVALHRAPQGRCSFFLLLEHFECLALWDPACRSMYIVQS